MRFRKIICDLFTGPDGTTVAIGRIYSIPTLVTGLGLPVYQSIKGQAVSLSELAVLLPATAGALMVLIAGTNHVDLPNVNMLGNPTPPQPGAN